MQQLRRDGDLGDLELTLRRNELTQRLEEFRRRLAAEIGRRLGERPVAALDVPDVMRADELDLDDSQPGEREELRRVLRPLLRRLAVPHRPPSQAALHRPPRLAAHPPPFDAGGRCAARRRARRRHPHRPEIVVLCDVSGSVAEFAQFTFTIVNALHDELRTCAASPSSTASPR